MITIFMPVSRADYLDRVFAGLELLECNRATTNLLVIVDGDNNLFVRVRNMVEESKFAQRLCVPFHNKEKIRNFDVMMRRKRIAQIHNQAKDLIKDGEFMFGTEDDTIIPSYALKRLLKAYELYPHAGMIEGVELGRWGYPMVGAWKVNDIYDPTYINTVMPDVGVTEIDAGGFYCFLTKLENYKNHDFKPFENVLGPDVNYGLSLRQEGQQNYIDWGVNCTHYAKDEQLSLKTTEPVVVKFKKLEQGWHQV